MALDDGPLRRPGSAPRWWRTPVLPLLRKLTGQSRRGRRHVLGPVTEEVAVTATSPAGSGTLLAPLTRPAPHGCRARRCVCACAVRPRPRSSFMVRPMLITFI